MAECEVCGKKIPFLKRAEIDGVILDVCEDCAKLGKEVYQPKKVFLPSSSASRTPRPESIEDERELASDFSIKVKKAREKLNLTQDEAAMKMGISALIYKRIENGFKPDEQTAKKIQRFFGVELYLK
jgi:putative transcription factor